ncbi:hypothetical protein E2C01_079497 [Portunus trituberculatus]|uniref:Uncharacterized protein n=1 Tax=Portunus trituberculatus TaxID=210409 RepID=A0A5B7IVS8_PORTR|nr:hypothetical protein [Portunus trituberculatus]
MGKKNTRTLEVSSHRPLKRKELGGLMSPLRGLKVLKRQVDNEPHNNAKEVRERTQVSFRTCPQCVPFRNGFKTT